jgi:Vitamin K-dependent gamma-carboxylase
MIEIARRRFDRFFFESCDPRLAPLIRVAYAALLVVYTLVLIPDAARWFSDHGILSIDSARKMTGTSHESLFFYVTSPAAIRICLGTFLLQAIMLLFGCWSRFQAACVFCWLVSFQHRNLMITDGEDVVFRWFAFFMIFLPLDHRWSLSRRFSSSDHDSDASHMWSLRLIQIQMVVIYLSSAWCKLLGETWRNGSASFHVARMDDYFGRLPLPTSLFDEPWLFRSLTWGTIAIEALVPIFIWLPRFRVLCLIAAASSRYRTHDESVSIPVGDAGWTALVSRATKSIQQERWDRSLTTSICVVYGVGSPRPVSGIGAGGEGLRFGAHVNELQTQ